MWLLAVRTLRFRKGGFAGTFVAMVLATAIVLACGSLMETGIRVTVPPQRLEAAAIVVVGDRSYRVPGTDESADLAEQVRIPAGLLDEVERVPGVGEAVGESAFPVVVVRDGRDVNPTVATFGHGWSSVALAPYTLVAGQPPRGPGDVVLDAALERRSGATVGDRVEMVIRGDPGAYRV